MSTTLSRNSRPVTDSNGPGVRVDALFSFVAAIGYRVWFISVDLPEPDTPVTQVNVPKGILRFTFFKLLPVAPKISKYLPFFAVLLLLGIEIIRL